MQSRRVNEEMPTTRMLLGALCALLLNGCDMQEPRTYKDLDAIGDHGDGSVIAATEVPKDATGLIVNSSIESGEYHLSYVTSDQRYAVDALKMYPVTEGRLTAALESLGFGVKLPEDVSGFVVCRESDQVPAPGEPRAIEIIVLANEHRRQHQCNVLYNKELERCLCG